MGERFLGIDFSGAPGPWGPKVKLERRTVWIASVEGRRLVHLQSVQDLPRPELPPFERLASYLAAGDFDAAGIDAPFSIPGAQVGAAGYEALLAEVTRMPVAGRRPFAKADLIVAHAQRIAPFDPDRKLWRETEHVWRAKGVNTRSALWNKIRGGAPSVAACMTLLARAGRPIWPWSSASGMLVEAFPAGQLCAWSLPFELYSPPSRRRDRTPEILAARRATRKAILDGVTARTGLEVSREHERTMLDSPDALDALIAAFGARAAATGKVKPPPTRAAEREGWIAVHD